MCLEMTWWEGEGFYLEKVLIEGHLIGLKYERQGVSSVYIEVNRFQAEGPASVKALWWE